MALMCNLEVKDLNIGDFLTLLCALSGALHIIYIEKVVNSIESSIEFNFLQSFFVAIFSISTAYIFKGPVNFLLLKDIHSKAVLGVFYLGIVSSMISFSLQVVAQKKIPSHIVGLIFLTESPFAAFFGYLVFGEVLNGLNILGASLIMLALVLVPVLGREVTTSFKGS
jgi:drug/metabolite transporter (DMT)-like permease